MNNCTLLYGRLLPIELEKDVVLVPYYLGRGLGYRIDIVCNLSKETSLLIKSIDKVENRVSFVHRKMGVDAFSILCAHVAYLLKHAQHIDVLMCFHLKATTILKVLLYKMLNSSGKAYVKLDTNGGREFAIDRYKNPLHRWMRKYLYLKLITKVDILSCETSIAYKTLCADFIFGSQLKNKLILMPNGFDEEKLQLAGVAERSYIEKEKLMIRVGSLGSLPKNTEMFLRALSKVNLKGWKVTLIGPVEDSLKPLITTFFKQYPDKAVSVEFTGAIYDKKTLWEYYNRARVFVFTSRWESYGLVLNEAKRFRNYIISTDVGAANDLLENGRYGTLVGQDDAEALALQLQKIVDGDINIDVYENYTPDEMSYKYQVDTLLKYLS